MLVGPVPLDRLREVIAAFLGGLSSALIVSSVRLPNVAFEARSVQTASMVERGGGSWGWFLLDVSNPVIRSYIVGLQPLHDAFHDGVVAFERGGFSKSGFP